MLNDGSNPDIVTTNLTYLFVPASPASLLYDPDGNLTNDGHFSYTWNSENQLTSVVSLTNTPAESKHKLTFEYDALGRRIRAGVSRWTNNVWLVTSSNKFVYDGWNLVAELNATNNALIRSYAWGLDLSGSLDNEAGGVGGLLWVNDAATLGSNSTHLVTFDGNGNVTALVDAGSGNETARYEYGPFGETLRGTGLMAGANPFRFSSKYHDDESDLVYYGYRYYDPITRRWLNRDPLGEEGGLNLYGFVESDPVNATDALGLVSSLNFVPASELAWMLGGSAAFDASLSIAMQKAMAGPCDKLNWNQVGKDVGIGAALTVGTFGLSKAYELYQAGKLAKLLRGADELRELGRYDELTEMIAKHGDEFGDSLMAYRRAKAASLVVQDSKTFSSAGRLGAGASPLHPGALAAKSTALSQASIMRALRKLNTREAQATAALLKRGKTELKIFEAHQKGYRGFHPFGTKSLEVYKAMNPSAEVAAQTAIHETRHWLQKLTPETYHQGHEFEAMMWEGFGGVDEIWKAIKTHYSDLAKPPASWSYPPTPYLP